MLTFLFASRLAKDFQYMDQRRYIVLIIIKHVLDKKMVTIQFFESESEWIRYENETVETKELE